MPDTHKPQQGNNDNFGLPLEEFKPIDSPRNKRWVRTTIIVAGLSLLIGSCIVLWLLQHPSGTIQYLRSKLQETKEENREVDSLGDTQQATTDAAITGTTPGDIMPIPEVDIPIIDSPRGLYYVVIGSYIDIDLAKDHAKKLLQEGIVAKIIAPSDGGYFYRLCVAEAASREEATVSKETFKEKYNGQIWVMKY